MAIQQPDFQRLFVKNIRDLETKQKQLYTSAQIKFRDNNEKFGNQGWLNVKTLLTQGVDLWNELIGLSEKEYKNGNAVVIEANRRFVGSDKYDTTLYDSVSGFVDNYSGSFALPKDNLVGMAERCFVWFSNKYQADGENRDKKIFIANGEGTTLMHSSEAFIEKLDGYKDNKEGISYIAGPTMVCDNSDGINNFIIDMLNEYKKGAKSQMSADAGFEINANRLFPLTKLYGGYFHCHVVGNSIFAESPHEFVPDPQNARTRYRIILNNAKVAERLRRFLIDYINVFTQPIGTVTTKSTEKDFNGIEEKIGRAFFTLNTATQTFDRQKFLDSLKNKPTPKKANNISQ